MSTILEKIAAIEGEVGIKSHYSNTDIYNLNHLSDGKNPEE